jgi:ABC-type sugar transport system ATPase subunit
MATRPPLLSMEHIEKRFPGVHALDQVNFDLHEGEVHILLGENGAGKSTLMKILSGSLPADSGRIVIQGEEVRHHSPDLASKLRIGMVYQEFSLVPTLTVAENIFLGRLPRNGVGLIKWREVHRRTRESLKALGVDIDPFARTSSLSVAEQQLTDIARILTKDPRILLLDEPTSALSDMEVERLFEIIRRLQGRGVGIIYISHRLDEVPRIGSRVTVMRDGRVIGTLPIEQADKDVLIGMMVGRQLNEQYPKTITDAGAPVLRVENLSAEPDLHNLSFEVGAGEIVGIFGLMGAGQTHLAHTLFGLEPKTSGQLYINGEAVKIRQPTEAIKHGLGFLLRDRQASLVPAQGLPSNISLPNVSQVPFWGALNLREEERIASKYVDELTIRPPVLKRPVKFLSGGNQQKVCLARWLATGAKVLIVDEPTRGIDVGAKAEVFALLDHLASDQRVGIILISSEMPEILAMADRILVMRDGEFTAEFQRGEATQEMLLKSAS